MPAQNATAQAQQAGQATGVPGVGIYTLGQLDMIGGSTITNEAMWTFNKNSVDQAVGILPGVTMTNTGGSRNEKDILVRGFDRFRVPLYMDGVRIYLPYDNRLDFNRFLTPDLSEIQVEKGYVSVLNGPGGEGGAINLVSRKPTKEIELEGRSGVIISGDLADLNQWNAYACRNPAEGLLRAIEWHDRRSVPLQPVRQLHAQHAFKHARISVELPLRGWRLA